MVCYSNYDGTYLFISNPFRCHLIAFYTTLADQLIVLSLLSTLLGM